MARCVRKPAISWIRLCPISGGRRRRKSCSPENTGSDETACPTGYARAGGDREVELCYKDQYTAVVLEEVCIENDATRIVSTTVRNAAGRQQGSGRGTGGGQWMWSAWKTCSPGASYTLRGMLVDQRTGELLEPAGGTEGASVISEVQSRLRQQRWMWSAVCI